MVASLFRSVLDIAQVSAIHRASPALQAASRMPPLNHWPGHSFDIMRSEVAQWLCDQPELRQELFNWCKHRGIITFDLETRRWRGVEWRC
jgi:hypothetical protein